NPFYRVRTIEFLVDLHITSQLKELGHVEIRARLVVYKDHFLLIDETLDAAVNRTTKTFSNNNLLGKGDLVVVLDALVPVEEGLDCIGRFQLRLEPEDTILFVVDLGDTFRIHVLLYDAMEHG